MKKIKGWIIKYWDILSYLLFGGMTTLVNFSVYFPLYHWLHISAFISNTVAWGCAVIFAYLTNKPFVFKSHDWSAETVIPELGKFVGCRIGSGILETVILAVCVDILKLSSLLMKILTAVFVVVTNYLASKLLVFRRK